MIDDLRLAFRSLRRRPGSTGLAVVALALGIGTNAAIFSLVQGIVIRPLPFPDPGRPVELTQSEGPRSASMGAVSPRDLQDFKTLDQVFAGLAGSQRDGRNVSFAGSAERLSGLAVEPGYFEVLGVSPRLGRAFAANEDEEGSDAVVILSHRLFERRFDSDPAVLTRFILMDGRQHRIVGVTLGLAAATGLARAMSGLVFGIPALDPATFVAAPLALLIAAALASLLPALRASRIEPTTALRDE